MILKLFEQGATGLGIAVVGMAVCLGITRLAMWLWGQSWFQIAFVWASGIVICAAVLGAVAYSCISLGSAVLP
jgi:hypothetical protein